jgi:ABC-2 type transport system ATP-binding protein
MTSFTQVSHVLAVEVDEGLPDLAAELARRGVAARQDERALLIRLEDEATYDVIRDVIAELGLPLNRLERRRRRVEELFRDEAGDAA